MCSLQLHRELTCPHTYARCAPISNELRAAGADSRLCIDSCSMNYLRSFHKNYLLTLLLQATSNGCPSTGAIANCEFKRYASSSAVPHRRGITSMTSNNGYKCNSIKGIDGKDDTTVSAVGIVEPTFSRSCATS